MKPGAHSHIRLSGSVRRPKPERDVQRDIVDLLARCGISVKAFRIGGATRRSTAEDNTPDILCCVQGRFVAIECKSEQGRLGSGQWEAITDIEAAGGIGIVARNVEDVARALRAMGVLR